MLKTAKRRKKRKREKGGKGASNTTEEQTDAEKQGSDQVLAADEVVLLQVWVRDRYESESAWLLL